MRKLTGLLLLCFAVLLGGCTSDSVNQGTFQHDDNPIIQATDNATAETTEPNDPNRIYKKVREDFLIDADIVDFPSNDGVKVFEAIPKHLSQEEINKFLTAKGDTATEWEMITCTGTTAHGGEFQLRHGVALTSSTLYYKNTMHRRWGDCSIYYGQRGDDDVPNHTYAYLFTEPKDFSFATAEEAEEEVRDILRTHMGLEDLLLNRTLYIDHKILANELTTILQDEEVQAMDKTGHIPVYYDWSEADDGYIFEFFPTVDGAPMFYPNMVTDTMAYLGSSVQVWYQESGIVYLSIDSSMWSIGNVVETASTPLSPQDAMSIAQVRLENTMAYSETEVYKVSGEYIHVQDRNRILLRPVWVVYAKSTSSYSGNIYTQYVVIDAITGDEIM